MDAVLTSLRWTWGDEQKPALVLATDGDGYVDVSIGGKLALRVRASDLVTVGRLLEAAETNRRGRP